jgi:signal peptidase II|tara:strand:+ start:189 stop:674 length:486 start_codon:yes stop_codon:yes gene_type:complete
MIKKNLFISSSFILLIFLLDRVSKTYVIYLNDKLLGSEIFSSKFLNIYLIWNEGIAFGLLSFQKENLYDILSLIILFVILAIFFISIKSRGIKKYCYLMILGGALGNFFDRIFYKAVPDFIDFHVGNFHWFIFNIADIFISLGIIFLIFLEFTDITKEKKI